MNRIDKIIDSLDVSIATVSAIIERNHNGKNEILVQTRWKPEIDPKYSGTFEIPAGWIGKYESVYDSLKREVFEETGLRVLKIKPDIKTKIYSPRDDGALAFVPFCCQQQIKGSKSCAGFVFVCQIEDKEPIPQNSEVKEIIWVTKSKLKKIINETPEKIFTFQLGALDYYLNYNKKKYR